MASHQYLLPSLVEKSCRHMVDSVTSLFVCGEFWIDYRPSALFPRRRAPHLRVVHPSDSLPRPQAEIVKDHPVMHSRTHSCTASRYKATSDDDALLSRNQSPPPSNNKRRRVVGTSAAAAADGTGAAATAAPGSSSSRKVPSPTSPNAGAVASQGEEESSISSSESTRGGGDCIVTPTVAMEVAAHEIALSATPTALSWALVSLLADGGGMGSSNIGASGGGEAKRRRGQGHLLPRSRDKYPTPVRGG